MFEQDKNISSILLPFLEFFFQILITVAEYKLCKISRTISSTKISLSLGIPPSFSKRFKVLFSVYGAPFYYSLNREFSVKYSTPRFRLFPRCTKARNEHLIHVGTVEKRSFNNDLGCFVAPPGGDSSKTRDRYIRFTSIMTGRRESKPLSSSRFETSNTCRDMEMILWNAIERTLNERRDSEIIT